jgi:transposase
MKANPNASPPHPYDLIIGLDRSDAKANLFYIDTRSKRRWSQILDTAPERLHDWLAKLRQEYPKARVALCLEQPAINVILFIEDYAWITLYPINPITLQKFREAFVTSRAKDDAKDAEHLAELLLTHHDKLKAWSPEDSQTRRLQQAVLHRRAVVDERTGLTNRLQALLKQYFPQALELCGEELWRPLATDFLLRWPSLQAVQKAEPAALKAFYHLHGSRSQSLLAHRLELIANAVPLTDEGALIDSFVLRIQLVCRELQCVVQTIAQFDAQVKQTFADHPDHDIFASLPGAGPVLGPRLLASLGAQRDRYQTAADLQAFTGIAPVTKQSGGKCHVHRRYRCPKFQRQSYHEYAKESVLHCRWAAAYYYQQREKGASHHTAVRALGFKWQRIIFRCWQDRTTYDDKRYEKSLKTHRSPLAALFKLVTVGKNPVKSHAE